jgi:hypothetical protein
MSLTVVAVQPPEPHPRSACGSAQRANLNSLTVLRTTWKTKIKYYLITQVPTAVKENRWTWGMFSVKNMENANLYRTVCKNYGEVIVQKFKQNSLGSGKIVIPTHCFRKENLIHCRADFKV